MSPCDQLSGKEIKVATMMWEGKTNPEIAAIVGSTEQVVKNQLRGVFDKLGVWSRLELALYVASHGGCKWANNSPTVPETPAQVGSFAARSAAARTA